MRHLEVADGKFKKLTEMRARMLFNARCWFEKNNYIEIPCPHITGATGSCEWFPNAMPLTLYDANDEEKKMFLRQTAQLYLEGFTQVHNRVYTIGSSFRQERGVSERHLSEFNLIELEERNLSLKDLMLRIEELVKFMFLAAEPFSNAEVIREWRKNPFARITYRTAINLINEHSGYSLPFGHDLKSDHELWLCEWLNGPVFVTHYPAAFNSDNPDKVIKFFSMKRNPENNETYCADLLLPGVGEAVGSAVREGNSLICKGQFQASIMYKQMLELGIDPAQFEWYFEVLRAAKENTHSSGCGIGFERVVQCILNITGKNTIQDAVEIPRSTAYLSV